jgi:hypothetical protein
VCLHPAHHTTHTRAHLHGADASKAKCRMRRLGLAGSASNRSVFFLQPRVSAIAGTQRISVYRGPRVCAACRTAAPGCAHTRVRTHVACAHTSRARARTHAHTHTPEVDLVFYCLRLLVLVRGRRRPKRGQLPIVPGHGRHLWWHHAGLRTHTHARACVWAWRAHIRRQRMLMQLASTRVCVGRARRAAPARPHARTQPRRMHAHRHSRMQGDSLHSTGRW